MIDYNLLVKEFKKHDGVIYYLANTVDFDGRKLQEAIFETLQNRNTVYE